MELSVQNFSSFQFSSIQELYQSSSDRIEPEKESNFFRRESTGLEISQESRFLARINPESSVIKFDFSLNAKMEESTFDLYDEVANSPEINKLMPLLDYLSEVTGRDLKKEFFDGMENMSGKLKDARSSGSLYEITGDIARASSISSEVSLSVNFELRTGETRLEVEGALSDPLVLDLDGDGIETTGIEDGIDFDINGDGILDRTSFAAGGDGLLSLDRDGDGRITSGKELFGDQNGAEDGFLELEKYDENRDQIINNKDSVFKDLKIVISNDQGEFDLKSLEDMGIEEIYLNKKKRADYYNNGNYVKEASAFKRTDGTEGNISELYFRYSTALPAYV